jgi:hypothetical protein
MGTEYFRKVQDNRPLFLLTGLIVLLASVGCSEVEGRLWVHGFPLDAVELEIKDLGRLDPEALQKKMSTLGTTDLLSLPVDACAPKICRSLVATVYIRNPGDAALPPPVIRIDSPNPAHPRIPLSSSYGAIEVGRTGRIRFVTTLWPGETTIDVHLSGSVYVDVNIQPSPAPPASSIEQKANDQTTTPTGR